MCSLNQLYMCNRLCMCPFLVLNRLYTYRLLQRYQNVKSELESQQNIERIRAEKYMYRALTPAP